MKKTLFFLLALLMVGSGFAQKAPQAKLISSTEERIVVNFQLNGFNTARVATPQGEQYVVSVPKMAGIFEVGAPDLPLYSIPVIIGDQAEMTINVIDAQYTDYSISIAPSKGIFSRQINPDDVPYTYGAVYQQNAFWPATQARLEKPYILRDFRGQNIMVQPFAYNPVTKTLRVYESMTIEITKVSDNGENQKVARRSNTIKVAPEQKAQYSHRFINFGKTEAKYNFLEDDGEMLVICADQFMAGMQPFVDWKNQSGRPTTMVSVTEAGGNNADAIKSYITNMYNDAEHNLTYLLFVGDYAHITPHPFQYDGQTEYSDNWFGQIEGNDYYPEIFVGRFSVESDAHVATHVNKVLYYERDMQADVTWGDHGLGIGHMTDGTGWTTGHYGEADYQHIDYIRDTLLHYTYSQVTEHHGGGGTASVSTISATINQGVSVINYCNHGSEYSWGVAGYSTSDVHSLTNDNKLPIVWSVACLNGKFNYSPECFAEAWMRATNNTTGVPTGAIGGMFSWISQPWQPPMYGQDEMVDILTEWRSTDLFNHTLAGASLNGNMAVLDQGSADQFTATHNAWLLFGDPTLMVRTANPTELNISLNPAVLMIGMSSLEVSAEAEYGIATLTNEEGIVASAKIIDGSATLEFPALNAAEDLTLTVIGYNKVTEVTTLSVLPAEGAFMSLVTFSPNTVPVNEEQLMSMTLKNVGVEQTAGITNVVLSCDDQRLTFSDNEASFEALGADQTVTLTDEFAFTVAPGVADGTKLQIDVTMTCGTNVWTGKARVTVGAPIIAFDAFQCVGGFTPGESQDVVVKFKNSGHYMATNAVVTVTSENPYITFANETFNIGTIEAEGYGTATFNVIIDAACPQTSVIDLAFSLVADNEVTATGVGSLKNTCNVVFDLTDTYGDGWNGNQLVVSFSDGTPSQNLTISSGNSASYTLEIGMGTIVTLTWISGNYTHEVGFTVSYEGGEEITSIAASGEWGTPSVPENYSFEFTVQCGGAPIIGPLTPVSLLTYTVDEENRTLELNWTAPEDAIGFIITRDSIEMGSTTMTTFIDKDPIESTTYCVIAQYMAGNAEPVCVEVGGVWGIEEGRSEIRIYPNPVNGILYLEGGDAEYSYMLYNGMGQMITGGTANGTHRIDCSAMTKGVYFLHLTTGDQVTVEKIMVK